ncbi:TetR/AcrR family transcriptional regulator C-terminal domain-containing protein [Dactylosporangium sp. CA-152071]|uniref:TetR/AcrR family transcriptional regulator C-terminal domain-containing protein n=1 Tax=Dactylosporangium sp. CA-152071 TaxID=3239933 RepID=UPI003D8E523C
MKTGGRVATFTLQDVIRAGVDIGLPALTVQGVADTLGVSAAAVYRHVAGRSALEGLVGEAILDRLEISDNRDDPAVAHLVGFAVQLRRFALRHPGSAQYFLRMFPRGPSGTRLLEQQIAALGRRGYDPATATAFSGAIATLSLGAVVAEQERAIGLRDLEATKAALAELAGSRVLRQASAAIPEHTQEDYFVFMLTAAATGLVNQFPPGRPITVTPSDQP